MNFADIGDFELIYATKLAKVLKCRVEKAKKLMEDGTIPSKEADGKRFTTGLTLKDWARLENSAMTGKRSVRREQRDRSNHHRPYAPITETLKKLGL